MATRKPPPAAAVAEALENADVLDAPAGMMANAVTAVVRKGRVRDFVAGRPLGHAVHPALTDVAVGVWMSSVILDLGGSATEAGADALIAVGMISALPTAATGWWDFSQSSIAQRRVGLVHAASNLTALALFSASWRSRRGGGRARGRALSALGAGALGFGGLLGGHLAFARGVGVGNRTEPSAGSH